MNIAVQRLLSVQRDPVTTDAQFLDAANRGDLVGAVAYLAPLAAAVARVTVGKLNLSQCEALLTKVGPDQHTARGVLLERGFDLTKGVDWAKAARFIIVLDDPGIAAQVAGLKSDAERKQLAKGARNGPSGGDARLLNPIRDALRKADGQLFGSLTANWTPTDGAPSGMFGGGRPYFFKMDITFKPDPEVVDATQIGFIQTISMLRTGTTKSEEARAGVDQRFNDKKQAIDRDPKMTSGWLGQQNDGTYSKGTTFGATPGSVVNGVVGSDASMVDTVDNAVEDVTFTFETSVVAKAGPDQGLVYAVLNWSFQVDGKRKIINPQKSATDRPTKDFGTAMAAWNKQAAGRNPSAQGQLPLPAVR